MRALQFFLCLVFQAVCLFGWSQKQSIKFSYLETDEGLSQSNVLCILQDSRGFMWFGTEDGLNKYDGYKFTVYKNDSKNNASLSNNNITDIIEDRDGNLWIATWGGGLDRYDRRNNAFVHYQHNPNNPHSISDNFLTRLEKDSDGNIWILADVGGINVLNKERTSFINYNNLDVNTHDSEMVYPSVIYKDKMNNMWIGTVNQGLCLFNAGKKTFTHFLHSDRDIQSISNNNITCIFEDSRRQLWIGTNGGGLNLLDRQTMKFRVFKKENTHTPGLCDNVVFSIAEDNKGRLWIGSENNGISVFHPEAETFVNYQYSDLNKNCLNSNSINKVFCDTKGNIWIGTYNAGLNLLTSDVTRFAHYNHSSSPNSLTNNKVLCLYEDHRDNLWIATDGGGLDLFDRKNGQFKHYKHIEGNNKTIGGDNVMSVMEDDDDNLWVGTYGNGVTVMNNKNNSYRYYKNVPSDPHSLSDDHAAVVYEDKEKNIWVGTQFGLNLYDKKNNSFIRYSDSKNHFTSNLIMCLTDDSDYLWIGTESGGLNRLDKKTNIATQFLHDDNKNSISSNSINCFYADRKNNLWIGTNKGLNCLNRKTNQFSTFGLEDGLPHDKVVGILEDANGNLWLSTGRGLSKFNPQNKSFKNFDVSDGLQANEFRQAFCKSRSGAMYFGGINGFNEFFPNEIKESSFDPPLVITDFRIFNKSVPIAHDKTDDSPLKQDISETKTITIPYRSSVVSFDFASLNYTTVEKKQYSYMLEGFDKDWNYVGTSHTATYTNLNPGEYLFRVRGLNNNGSWSTNITDLHLSIKPPFVRTWWFRMILLTSIIGSAFAFYRIRINNVQVQKRKLQLKVYEQTKQVLQSAKDEQNARQLAEFANKELERKNKELEQFAYVASHDMQEPLRTTSSFVELLHRQYNGKLDEKADKYLNFIRQSSDRMKTLIMDLLDYSRIGVKKELTPVDCNEVIKEVLADIDMAVKEAKAEVKTGNLPIINGYATEIKQLFQNLMVNAVKFRRTGVQPQIRIDASRKNGCWEFTCKDNGIGIEKQYQERIFIIFQRLHNRSEYDGSGIGLAHCKKIVEMHGGKIWLESEPRQGTTFHFTLPYPEPLNRN